MNNVLIIMRTSAIRIVTVAFLLLLLLLLASFPAVLLAVALSQSKDLLGSPKYGLLEGAENLEKTTTSATPFVAKSMKNTVPGLCPCR